jgi:23S rRNA (adenine2503-C2)-methyltransferase
MLAPVMRENSSQLFSFDNTGRQSRKSLFGLDAEALAACMVEASEPAWRGRQLAEALYRQRIAELSEITTLAKALRQRLAFEGWQVGRPTIAQVFQSADGTERYLVEGQSGDGLTVETVWMPEGDDGEAGDGSDGDGAETLRAPSFPRSSAERVGNHALGSTHRLGAPGPGSPRTGLRPWGGVPDFRTWETNELSFAQKPAHHATICVSSQVGCAVNCDFCLTARLGLQRNLTAGEIAGQVLAVFDRHAVEVGRDRVNLVFMGMGEPFLNYDNFMGAVRLLVREVGLSPQRMTVSTSGIVPGIERFAAEPPEFRPKLAISLNAPNDAVRSQIMPINRKWPIAAVIDAVRQVKLRPRERITFEYVLLGGITDRPEQAIEVARLIRRTGLPAKVNLIAWNPGPGIHYATPQPEAVEAFRRTLADEGIQAYVRKPRGRDIYAACGQLKRTVEG